MDINKSDIFKRREFSELISDTLNFYIREAKSLFKFIFKYILLFIIVKSLVAHNYAYVFYFEYENFPNFFELLRYGSGELIGFVLILKLIDFLQYTMLIVVIGTYVKLYAQTGIVEKKDIGQEIKTVFFKILGSNALIVIILSFSLIALILPALYLFVIFSIVPFIIIFEDLSIGKAISKSLRVFKGNWWKSFGAFLVISLIYFIFTLIVSLIFPRLFMSFGFIPFVFIISSLATGILYAFATALPILLAVTLYTSSAHLGETQIKTPKKKQSIKRKKDKQKTRENPAETKKPDSLHEDDEWANIENKEEQKNRFLDDNETDRFKSKY